MVRPSKIGDVSRSLRTDPRTRQALRNAGQLERVRIRVHLPRPGFAHPADRRDVRAVLDAIGAEAWYGLHVVELRQTEDFDPRSIVYGRTRTPGEILLYEQREHEAAALRDFIRFDVLLHELGHHVLQHSARKVLSVRRTSEHERFADMFARRWKPAVRAALSDAI
jgi:hypothetical protein